MKVSGEVADRLRGKMGGKILFAINGGSSSLKLAAFSGAGSLDVLLRASVDRIQSEDRQLAITLGDGDIPPVTFRGSGDVNREIAEFFKDIFGNITAVGHRLVHGGLHCVEHHIITEAMLDELKEAIPLDRAHFPGELALIDAFRGVFPAIPQVACFDTVFHRDMPKLAQLLPIPLRYERAGLRRFGFHGLSYTYLFQELARLTNARTANGRIILAHLGSGASMAAMKEGKPMETTMAFTPLAGLVMGTRPGDVDPGLITYLMETEKLSALEMDDFLNRECGLLGLSETTSDMRDLLARRGSDVRAAQAIDLFCYQAKKSLAGLAATLGGLDTLVFSAGIGAHTPAIRAQICEGLEFLGIHLDAQRNERNEAIISCDESAVTVRIIPTDEELIIAQTVRDVLHLNP